MFINAFWFGVLLTVIGFIVLMFIIAFISVKRQETEEEVQGEVLMDEDAFKKMLSDAVREALRENIVFGEEIADKDDENH